MSGTPIADELNSLARWREKWATMEPKLRALAARVAELEREREAVQNGGFIPTRWEIDRQVEAEIANRPAWLDGERVVRIERMRSPYYEGVKYAVRGTTQVLNRNGEWEDEPIPSERNAAFYARCRFDSLASACTAAIAWMRAAREASP